MYFNPSDGIFYQSIYDVRSSFQNTSFPAVVSDDVLIEMGIFPVNPSSPEYDPLTERVEQALPVLVDGHYVQQWSVYPLDAATIAANKAREAGRIRREIMYGVQRYLDDFATTKTYDSMLSACTYATSTVPQFAREAQYCVEKRDECWATVARIEAEALAGTRPAPTGFDEIRGELPVLEWP